VIQMKKRPMQPRVEEGLAKALKSSGVSAKEFNAQFKTTKDGNPTDYLKDAEGAYYGKKKK
tara:strand:+ start:1370 stop:1552 length:183 start_codon:yes stop_codon:yes gene_type:complete